MGSLNYRVRTHKHVSKILHKKIDLSSSNLMFRSIHEPAETYEKMTASIQISKALSFLQSVLFPYCWMFICFKTPFITLQSRQKNGDEINKIVGIFFPFLSNEEMFHIIIKNSCDPYLEWIMRNWKDDLVMYNHINLIGKFAEVPGMPSTRTAAGCHIHNAHM